MATFKLNREELNFVLGYLPAFKDVPESKKDIYTRIFGLLAAAPKEVAQRFQFNVDKNYSCKVNCIKTIRQITGWGLKEAKDAFDANTVFFLKDVKMGKEEIEAIVKTNSGSGSSDYGNSYKMTLDWFTS